MQLKYYNLELESKEIDCIVDYINKNLPIYNISPQGFRWEFSSTPRYFIQLIKINNELKGITAYKHLPIFIGNKDLNLGKGDYPYLNFRAKLFYDDFFNKTIENSKKNSLKAIFGISSAKALYTTFIKRYNWKLLPNIDLYNLDVKLQTTNKYFIKEMAYKFLFIINKAHNLLKGKAFFQKIQISKPDLRVFDVFKNESEYFHENLIYLNIDEQYYKSRIKKNPFLNFETRFFFDKNKKMIGYYILSVKEKTIHINEFLFLNYEMGRKIGTHMIKTILRMNPYRINYLYNLNSKISIDSIKIIKSNLILLKKISYCKLDNYIFKEIEQGYFDKIKNKEWYINALWFRGYDF